MMRRLAAAAIVLALTACASSAGQTQAGPAGGAVPAAEAEVVTAPVRGVLPPVRRDGTLPALMRAQWSPSSIELGEELERTDAYTRHRVTYRSADIEVSGQLLRPDGDGPFPAIVLNHGFIEPQEYVNGEGFEREQAFLARRGFVVLHTDYRGHAGAERGPGMHTRIGYAEDAINAVLALERESYVDENRVAMIGKSMGGGVTLNALVAYPDLVEAGVIFGSISSSILENFRHFTKDRPEALRHTYEVFGKPKENRSAYTDMSARSFFDRVSDPVLIHHGTADPTCPFPWATKTNELLKQAGADVVFEVYEGEKHTFDEQWRTAMDRTVRFVRGQF